MQRWVSARSVTSAAIKSIASRAGITWATGQKQLKKRPKTASNDLPGPRTEALYPTWLLPQPIQLATFGNSPVYQGKLQRLAGPQRLEATGWLMKSCEADKPPAIRDYFIYRSPQGALLWIYSERLAAASAAFVQPRAWYLQGFFA
jgi:protein ImuB